jgi:uroporphyrinogen decarboxylase
MRLGTSCAGHVETDGATVRLTSCPRACIECSMTPRENALRIIRFDNPERVQMEPPLHEIGYLGCNHEGYQGGGHHLPVGSVWTDIWGTTWHREHEGVMGFPRGAPLADLVNGLKGYAWPDPDDERLAAPVLAGARSWRGDETLLCGSHRDTLWEKSYMLVGMEELMCLLLTETEAVRELFHGIMDFQLGIARRYVEAGVEMVAMSDDLGTQGRLLLSRETIQDLLLPEYRRLFSFYKERGVLVKFHSCGHVEPILDLFMDIGVDVLNPVQASANDLRAVRAATAGRMALWGGVPSALLVSGPPEAIRAEARRLMRELGARGGYFCAPDQGMPWPEEHIMALRETVENEGRYPLP